METGSEEGARQERVTGEKRGKIKEKEFPKITSVAGNYYAWSKPRFSDSMKMVSFVSTGFISGPSKHIFMLDLKYGYKLYFLFKSE